MVYRTHVDCPFWIFWSSEGGGHQSNKQVKAYTIDNCYEEELMVICEFMIMRFHLFMEGDLEVMFE